MSSTADTLLFLPTWASEALHLKGMNVYINPRNNDEYVVFDTVTALVAPLGTNPWGSIEYDKGVYEEITAPMYRYDDPSYEQSAIEPQQQPSLCNTRLKRKRQHPVMEGKEHPVKMSKIAFANYFLNDPGQPDNLSVDLLGKIHDVLECVEITQNTLDVVNAVIQFIYTKSLQNTMGSVRRNKRFKREMKYILNKIYAGQ